MKKTGMIVMLIAALAACAPEKSGVQKTADENGTEIVLNQVEPLRPKKAPAALELTEEWSLDTGEDAIAEFGLTDIGWFEVDSRGNVYFAASPSHEKAVLKFDPTGRPAVSFGRRGQGPGEVQDVSALFLTAGDEVAVTSMGNNRLTVFDGNGMLRRETPIATETIAAFPLPTGSFVTLKRTADPKPEVLFAFPIDLAGPDFKVRTNLDTGFIENPMTGERLRGTYHIQSLCLSREWIFTGHQDRGYDIFIYDFEGRPVRKIRKEYRPVPVPESHKKAFLGQFDSPQFKVVRDKVYFLPDMPPFIGFTADETGRLYVMTYETTDQPGEFVFDIFDAEGVLILRKPLRVFHDYSGAFLKVRKDRLYCVQENANGDKEFKVFRMTWK